MSLLTEISRMKSIMGITESNLQMGLQKIMDATLQKFHDESFEMGLGEMDVLNELNSLEKIKITRYVNDEVPTLYVDLYVNSDRDNFDDTISSMEYEMGKYIPEVQIIEDNIIDTRELDSDVVY